MSYASQFWIALYGNLKRKDVPDGEWVLYAEPRESWQGLGVTPLPCELDRPAFGWQGVDAQFCMLLLLAWNDRVFKKDMVRTMSWWLICTWLGVQGPHIFHLRENLKETERRAISKGVWWNSYAKFIVWNEIPYLVLVNSSVHTSFTEFIKLHTRTPPCVWLWAVPDVIFGDLFVYLLSVSLNLFIDKLPHNL